MDASNMTSTIFYVTVPSVAFVWTLVVLVLFHAGLASHAWSISLSEMTFKRKQRTLGRGLVSPYNLLSPLAVGIIVSSELMARTGHWWAFGGMLATLVLLVCVHLSPLRSDQVMDPSNYWHLAVSGLAFSSLAFTVAVLPLPIYFKIAFGACFLAMMIMMGWKRWRRHCGIPQKVVIASGCIVTMIAVILTALSL